MKPPEKDEVQLAKIVLKKGMPGSFNLQVLAYKLAYRILRREEESRDH